MEAKIFMSVSQLSKMILFAFLLGTILGATAGGLVISKIKRRFKWNSNKFPKKK